MGLRSFQLRILCLAHLPPFPWLVFTCIFLCLASTRFLSLSSYHPTPPLPSPSMSSCSLLTCSCQLKKNPSCLFRFRSPSPSPSCSCPLLPFRRAYVSLWNSLPLLSVIFLFRAVLSSLAPAFAHRCTSVPRYLPLCVPLITLSFADYSETILSSSPPLIIHACLPSLTDTSAPTPLWPPTPDRKPPSCLPPSSLSPERPPLPLTVDPVHECDDLVPLEVDRQRILAPKDAVEAFGGLRRTKLRGESLEDLEVENGQTGRHIEKEGERERRKRVQDGPGRPVLETSMSGGRSGGGAALCRSP